VVPGAPLQHDLYLYVNGATVLFRRIGDSLTDERIKLLYRHGGEKFLVPKDQRESYLESMRRIIRDRTSRVEERLTS